MTRQIILLRGQRALVDDDVFEWLSQWKWRLGANGYVCRGERTSGEKYRTILLSREILNAPPGLCVDHKDHDPLNNTRSNLRICTYIQNQRNKALNMTGSSGFKGVSYHGKSKKWRAYIFINYKQHHIGLFLTEIEAAQAYNAKAKDVFGEFALLNTITQTDDNPQRSDQWN